MWLKESDHERAKYCREHGHDGFSSVMRPSNIDERMDWVHQWTIEDSPENSYPMWFEHDVMSKVRRERLGSDDLTDDLLMAHPRASETTPLQRERVMEMCRTQMGWS